MDMLYRKEKEVCMSRTAFHTIHKHLRLVHLKTSHFDEKIFIILQETLALVTIPINVRYCPYLCNILRVVLTFHLRHEGALDPKNCPSFGQLNDTTQKPS